MVDKIADKMKSHALRVVSLRGELDSLYGRYREMYFMEDDKKRPSNSNIDKNDWAITISPSARNEIVGMTRLLDTGEIHIEVKGNAPNPDKIEAALKDMLRVSGEFRRARVESDAALSAVLYGPVVMYCESVDDLLEVTNGHGKKSLERIKKRTPFLIRTINAEQSYPEWGEYGLLSHVWKYKVKGGVLTERWGVDADIEKDYDVYDVFDCENRLVYADGVKDNLFFGAHNLDGVPVVVRYAGGSSLFHESHRQFNSFLYAKAKSQLDKRENALLTTIATAINMQGLLGPLVSLDAEQDDVRVDFTGGVRFIRGKAQQVNNAVIDPVVFKWQELLDRLSGESTIYQQTLGQNTSGSTFSAIAMMSKAGQLPLIDARRAIESAFRDIFLTILIRIKKDGIENDLISPTEIPDDIDLDVKLEPDLAQDDLRNAQIVTQLKAAGATVSDEWMNTNLLKIADSNEMFKQKTKEEIRKAIFAQIIQDPETMKQFVQAAMGMSKPKPPQEKPPTGMPPEMMGAQGQLPMGAEGSPNMEQLPKTDAMPAAEERTNVEKSY